jgi:hypothetical protein
MELTVVMKTTEPSDFKGLGVVVMVSIHFFLTAHLAWAFD